MSKGSNIRAYDGKKFDQGFKRAFGANHRQMISPKIEKDYRITVNGKTLARVGCKQTAEVIKRKLTEDSIS